MVCLLNSCLYVISRSYFESLASVVPIKLVRSAAHCGAPRIAVRRALRCAAHCGAPRIAAQRTYMGSCRKK